ncbi:hypothetical protein FOL47_001223 [Perkinsus chesapeaki]|uniref:Uncharacterized protein n=1 Tax=Perkinsus chesapeaki TaxID=330153 RepID=A0A7J6MK25_PERCH|nr:hypothetical protein FOL47_001223 [Perkinsus chesapeaki]
MRPPPVAQQAAGRLPTQLLAAAVSANGVLDLLKLTQDAACAAKPPAAVPMPRVKSYVSTLDLPQRKLEKLAEVTHTVLLVGLSVCKHFELQSTSSSSSSTNSTEGSQRLVFGMDFGGGTNKVAVRPVGLSDGHGCLVVLDSRKDSRLTTKQIVHELKRLEQWFHLFQF